MTSATDAPGAGRRMGSEGWPTREGEAKAADYLARLQVQQADPNELALIVAALYGATLRGFCAALERALRDGEEP